jgi:hypothetical protein
VDSGNSVIGQEVVAVQIKEKLQIGKWLVVQSFVCFTNEMLAHQKPVLLESWAWADLIIDLWRKLPARKPHPAQFA